MTRTCIALLTAACLVGAALAVGPTQTGAASAATKQVSAKVLLDHLTVRAEDHAHRYKRARFGYELEWDADDDGCYTRKEVLIRDAIRLDKVSRSCAVYGRWRSLYDGKTYAAGDLQVDHLVPLAEAWHSGAWKWSHKKQIAFGNDLGYKYDLQAVSYANNQDKGDKEPGQWMPKKNRCTYVKAWIAVKYRWGLSVDPTEKADLARRLKACSSARILRPGTPDIARLYGSGHHLKHA